MRFGYGFWWPAASTIGWTIGRSIAPGDEASLAKDFVSLVVILLLAVWGSYLDQKRRR